MNKLVSIITPCYNGERYLDRYFNSLLKQTYPSVELIFVNDGSTDNTEKIALEFGEKLREKGYDFTYIYQENAGQSAAINQGLKIFKGEYLNWMDSDDYLPEGSVEKRVSFLEENPQIGLVVGRSVVVDDINYERIGLISETGMERTGVHQLVEDFLKGEISCTCCCSTMVRSTMFRASMPEPLQIETPRVIGQNYQLFLPIMFNYPVRYIPDILGYYVLHSDSHSHVKKTFEQKLIIQNVIKDTLYSIAGRLKTDEEEVEWFKSKIDEYDCKNRLNILQHHQRRDGLRGIINRMKEIKCYDAVAKRMVLKIRYPAIKRISDLIWKARN